MTFLITLFFVLVIALIVYFLVKAMRSLKKGERSQSVHAYTHDVVDRTVSPTSKEKDDQDDLIADVTSAYLINEIIEDITESDYSVGEIEEDNEIKFGGGQTEGGGAGGSWDDSSYDSGSYDYDSDTSFDDGGDW